MFRYTTISHKGDDGKIDELRNQLHLDIASGKHLFDLQVDHHGIQFNR